jgi:hypothetical protein
LILLNEQLESDASAGKTRSAPGEDVSGRASIVAQRSAGDHLASAIRTTATSRAA